MTATLTATPAIVAGRRDTAPVPFTRLLRVEAMKLIDTRAARWLLIVLAASLPLGGLTAYAAAGSLAQMQPLAWVDLMTLTMVGTSVLLPVVAILLFTTEWSQRTALQTFAMEPRRLRVMAAKAVAVLVATVIAFALAVVVALAAAAAYDAGHHGVVSWHTDVRALFGCLAVLVLGVASAVAFALLLMNSPAAIVFALVAPNVYAMLGLSKVTKPILDWSDLNTTSTAIGQGPFGVKEACQLLVAASLWIIVPAVIGLVRTLRTEVK